MPTALMLIISAVLPALQGCGAGQEAAQQVSLVPVAAEGYAPACADSAGMPDTVAEVSALAVRAMRPELREPDMRVRVRRGDSLVLRAGGLTLTATDSAVVRRGEYSVTALWEGELPPMPGGMVNVTAMRGDGMECHAGRRGGGAAHAAGGYRLLPSGRNFSPHAELRVAYDESLLPVGYTPDDIHTSYYDEAAGSWVRLERVAVDTARREIVSLTDHFTDFVNEVLKSPEMPETQAFVPTMMTELEAANPMEGIPLIQPPTANNEGTAALSYPIDIPAGRGGMQPSLSLTYSSGGGPGWLGVGWDIPIPTISVDTRWGVPRYDNDHESETYMYRGEQLVATGSDGSPLPLPHRTHTWTGRLPDGTRFLPRVDMEADSLVRHGTGPANYWWEVWDRNGVVHRFGHYGTLSDAANPSTLTDGRGNVARWCLTESEDAYGNTVRYFYDTVRSPGIQGSAHKGVGIYPSRVKYTVHAADTGYYTVRFHRSPYPRPDAVVSGVCGFKEVDASLLEAVTVEAGGEPLRLYVLGTSEPCEGSLFRTRLTSVTRVDTVLLADGMRWGELKQHFPGGVVSTATDSNGTRLLCGVPYAGVTTTFGYADAPAADDLFGTEVTTSVPVSQQSWYNGSVFNMVLNDLIEKPTALGATASAGCDIGGSVSAGIGCDVAFSTLSIGGSYSHSWSGSRGMLTLADLDGDGLSDKVYRRGGRVYWRRRLPHSNSDQEISYGAEHKLEGMDDFLVEKGTSSTWGANISLGLGFSASWPESDNYTTTYLADVNGDGLTDVVSDGDVLFNSLVNGVPTFSPVAPAAEPDGSGGTEMVPRVTVSTSGGCGGIVRDGAADPCLECAPTLASSTHYTEAGYRDSHDQMLALYPNGVWEMSGDADYPWAFNIYTRECLPSNGGDPDLEAVRVWVAPYGGTVTVYDTVRVLPGGEGLRHADGVVCRVQHNQGPVPGTDSYASPGTATEIRSFSIPAGDHNLRIDSVTSLTVSAGDLLFFRLGSGASHSADKVVWRSGVRYSGPTGVDSYGMPRGRFSSRGDFVVCGDGVFHAYGNGSATVTVDAVSADPVDVRVTLWSGGNPVSTIINSHVSGGTPVHVGGTASLATGDSLIVTATPSGSPYVRWGGFRCHASVTFTVPAQSPSNYGIVSEHHLAARVQVAHPTEYASLDNSLLHALFGPLYRGWGQFAYLNGGSGPLDVSMLRLSGLRAHALTGVAADVEGDTVDLHSLASTADTGMSRGAMEAIVAGTGAVDLTGVRSRWVPMLPDAAGDCYRGYGQTTFVARDSAGNCRELAQPQQTDITLGQVDSPVPVATGSGNPVSAVRKRTRGSSRGLSLAAGLPVISVGPSSSRGTSRVETDFMDLNGDRYPDLVGPGGVQYTQPWGGIGPLRALPSWLDGRSGSSTSSEGYSFGGPIPVPERTASGSPGSAEFHLRGDGNLSASGNDGQDHSLSLWADVNGDGLPDHVVVSGGRRLVAMNIGYTFLPYEEWAVTGDVRSGKSHSSTYGIGLPGSINIAQASVTAGLSMSRSRNTACTMMADINGDGLPDLVSCASSPATVRYGLAGGGVSAAHTLFQVGPVGVSNSFNDAASVGVTGGVTVLGIAKVTAGISGTPFSGGITRDSLQLADINGDGLPDLVSSDDEGIITVRYNMAGGANLLTSVTAHDGGSIVMEYSLPFACYGQPSRQWTLTKLERHDPRTPVARPVAVTLFSYSDPWHDRAERTSYGYASVTTTSLDSNSAPCRILVEDYHNRSYARRGRKRREALYDGAMNPYTVRHYRTAIAETTTSGDTSCPTHTVVTGETVITDIHEGLAAPQLTTAVVDILDARRNILTRLDRGDTSTGADDLRVRMHYLAGMARNMVSLRDSVTVEGRSGSVWAALRRQKRHYNAGGSLTMTVEWDAQGHAAETEYRVEGVFGNDTAVWYPPNHDGQRMRYRFRYDNVTHSRVDTVRDSYGRMSSTVHHPGWGLPLSVTDASGNTVRYTYDYAGRLRTVRGPLSAGDATLRHDYYPRGYIHNLTHKGDNIPDNWAEFAMSAEYAIDSCPRHSYAVTTHFSDDGTERLRTVTLADASRRIIQTRAESMVDSVRLLVVSGEVRFDDLGRERLRCDPDTQHLAFGLKGRYHHNGTPLRVTTHHDVLDRVTSTLTLHGTQTLTETTQYGVETVGGRRMAVTRVIDAAGAEWATFADARGRTLRSEDPLGGVTLTEYDAMGRAVSSTDPDGFTTTYTYDPMGRLALRAHPDAGATSYQYDLAGNMTQCTYATGATVGTDYHFSRPKERHYSWLPMNDVYYSYDNAGRLSQARDGGGTTTLTYDAMGNVAQTVRKIAVPGIEQVFRFTSQFVYDSWGRMLSMVYPDGDTVRYTYDSGWNLTRAVSRKGTQRDTLLRSVIYDKYGHRASVRLGDGSVTRYTYDDLQRMDSLDCRVRIGGATAALQRIGYTHDEVDNITRIRNHAAAVTAMGGPYTDVFEYDDLHRLYGATQGQGNLSHTLQMKYTGAGRLCERWQSHGGHEMYYGYDPTDKPHAPRRALDRGKGALYDLMWDAAGNLARVNSFALTQSGDAEYGDSRFLNWTEDSRLAGVVDRENYSYYAYGHDGGRCLKLVGRNSLLDVNADTYQCQAVLDEVTLYPSPYLVATGKGYTKHYYAGSERLCAKAGGGGLGVHGTFIVKDSAIAARANNLFKDCNELMEERQPALNDLTSVTDICGNSPGTILMKLSDIPRSLGAAVTPDADDFLSAMEYHAQSQPPSSPEDIYYFHGDHLGSASWVTDRSGTPVQHLRYTPFGEPFVDQHAAGATYSERFTFTGKERDEETGFSYYGARYYDPEVSALFLSVDPCADKYPGISPYAYCAWNPVKLVDPDGKKIAEMSDKWQFNTTTGRLRWINGEGGTTHQTVDIVHNSGDKTILDKTVSFNGNITRMFDCSVFSSKIDGIIGGGLDVATGVSEAAAGFALGVGTAAISVGLGTTAGIAAGSALTATGGSQIIFGIKDILTSIECPPNSYGKHNYIKEACKAGMGLGSSLIQSGWKGVWKVMRSFSMSAVWSYISWHNAAYPTNKGIPSDAKVTTNKR